MIDLLPVPDETWEKEFKQIMQDPYVSKKYNRSKRIKEKQNYVDKYLSEMENGTKVLDLGPGPGEFLEVCRDRGCDGIGIDALLGDSEMGNEYMKLASLMTKRQKLDVRYVGVENLGKFPFEDETFGVINSQGSIEQIFRNYLIGVPHKEHKNCNKLIWSLDSKMEKAFVDFFKEAHRVLKKNGILLIYGNGTKNTSDYDIFIRKVLEKQKLFTLTFSEHSRLHKMEKK